METQLKSALTIAGSDSSGGAGIQADIKTMISNGVFATTAITALTAQNTLGVQGILEVSPDFLAQQLDSVITDIFPAAVKIGMVANVSLIKTISSAIKKYSLKNIVVDPVMVSTSGSRLIKEDAIDVLKTELFPLAMLITPNIPEAEIITGAKISTASDMESAARMIFETYGCSVLLKGGHAINDASDYLYGKIFYSDSDADFSVDSLDKKEQKVQVEGKWFYGKKIDNPNTHGTGCTLSSAIASNLAKGYSLENAVESAKNYLSLALGSMLNLGNGRGPMNHGFAIKADF